VSKRSGEFKDKQRDELDVKRAKCPGWRPTKHIPKAGKFAKLSPQLRTAHRLASRCRSAGSAHAPRKPRFTPSPPQKPERAPSVPWGGGQYGAAACHHPTPIPTEGSALQGRTAAAEQSVALLIPAYAPLAGGRGHAKWPLASAAMPTSSRHRGRVPRPTGGAPPWGAVNEVSVGA
jgi:hypothetical protein